MNFKEWYEYEEFGLNNLDEGVTDLIKNLAASLAKERQIARDQAEYEKTGRFPIKGPGPTGRGKTWTPPPHLVNPPEETKQVKSEIDPNKWLLELYKTPTDDLYRFLEIDERGQLKNPNGEKIIRLGAAIHGVEPRACQKEDCLVLIKSISNSRTNMARISGRKEYWNNRGVNIGNDPHPEEVRHCMGERRMATGVKGGVPRPAGQRFHGDNSRKLYRRCLYNFQFGKDSPEYQTARDREASSKRSAERRERKRRTFAGGHKGPQGY